MRLIGQLAAMLLVVGLVLHFILWIIGTAAVAGALWLDVRMRRQWAGRRGDRAPAPHRDRRPRRPTTQLGHARRPARLDPQYVAVTHLRRSRPVCGLAVIGHDVRRRAGRSPARIPCGPPLVPRQNRSTRTIGHRRA